MHTVVELPSYLSEADDLGLDEILRRTIVDFLAERPEAGDQIKGSGGCRKIRFAGRGKGKSGGYREVTFFSGPLIPVFLITVFGKGDQANLSQDEIKGLAALTTTLKAKYGTKPARFGERS